MRVTTFGCPIQEAVITLENIYRSLPTLNRVDFGIFPGIKNDF